MSENKKIINARNIAERKLLEGKENFDFPEDTKVLPDISRFGLALKDIIFSKPVEVNDFTEESEDLIDKVWDNIENLKDNTVLVAPLEE